MKKYEVELDITQTFTTRVIVEGEFKGKNDPEVIKAARQKADNMDHNFWSYEDTEFEERNIKKISDNLSSYHYLLLECGYPLNKIKNYTVEDAEAELEAIGVSF